MSKNNKQNLIRGEKKKKNERNNGWLFVSSSITKHPKSIKTRDANTLTHVNKEKWLLDVLCYYTSFVNQTHNTNSSRNICFARHKRPPEAIFPEINLGALVLLNCAIYHEQRSRLRVAGFLCSRRRIPFLFHFWDLFNIGKWCNYWNWSWGAGKSRKVIFWWVVLEFQCRVSIL